MVPRGIEIFTAISLFYSSSSAPIYMTNRNSDMITKYIQRALLNKSNEHIVALRELNRGHGTDERLSANIKVLKEFNQLKGMHTVLHDRATTREEFVFYFDRISTLLVERVLDLVHHQTAQVETPQVVRSVGFKLTREVEQPICPTFVINVN